MEDADIH